MKVSIAVIKLVLRTNKVLADGTHPIMLRCSYFGMKERSTGYSCSVKFWDKKNECVKKGFPNFVMVNAQLKKLKDEAIKKRDEYVASGQVYSPSMILDTSEQKNALRNDLNGLIEHYIRVKGVGNRTQEHYTVVKNSIRDMMGRDILVNEINEAFVRRYAAYMESLGKKDCTIRCYLSKVGAICHYAIDNGLMKDYPFLHWRYNRIYKEKKRDYYINSRSLLILEELFTNECVEFVNKNGSFRYKDGVIEALMDRTSSLYGFMLFIAGIVYQGLAPIDLSYLKKKDISIIEISGKLYYKIDGSREKTGMPYKLRIDKEDVLSRICVETFLMFHDSEYLFPTMDGFIGKHRNKRVNNTYMNQIDNLKSWVRKCNAEIIKRNVENNDNIPLIEVDEMTFYVYRHTWIMREMQKPNVNLLRIATITGKALSSVHQYLAYLNDVDLV